MSMVIYATFACIFDKILRISLTNKKYLPFIFHLQFERHFKNGREKSLKLKTVTINRFSASFINVLNCKILLLFLRNIFIEKNAYIIDHRTVLETTET